MAEINIKRKDTPLWPWILGVLVAVALIIFLIANAARDEVPLGGGPVDDPQRPEAVPEQQFEEPDVPDRVVPSPQTPTGTPAPAPRGQPAPAQPEVDPQDFDQPGEEPRTPTRGPVEGEPVGGVDDEFEDDEVGDDEDGIRDDEHDPEAMRPGAHITVEEREEIEEEALEDDDAGNPGDDGTRNTIDREMNQESNPAPLLEEDELEQKYAGEHATDPEFPEFDLFEDDEVEQEYAGEHEYVTPPIGLGGFLPVDLFLDFVDGEEVDPIEIDDELLSEHEERRIEHEHTAEGIYRLSEALHAVTMSEGLKDIDAQARRQVLGEYAFTIEEDPEAEGLTALVREAFGEAVDWMDVLQILRFPDLLDQVVEARKAAEDIDPQLQLVDQDTRLEVFFKRAGDVIEAMDLRSGEEL